MSYAMVSAFQQDILKLFVVFFFYNDAKFLLNGKAGKSCQRRILKQEPAGFFNLLL